MLRYRVPTLLVLTIAAAPLWACSDDGEAPSVDSGVDALVVDAQPKVDTAPPADLQNGTCVSQPGFAQCPTPSAAPESSADVKAYIADSAYGLQCEDQQGKARWQLRFFEELVASKKVLIFGEVHGANELTPISLGILEGLFADKHVDAFAAEVPMDFADAYAAYVKTGNYDSLKTYYLDTISPRDFRRGVPERLRELSQQGVEIPFVAVDVPWRLAWVTAALDDIAKTITDPTVAKLLTEDRPAAKEYGDTIDSAYVTKAAAFEAQVEGGETALCGALAAETCERAVYLARALWLSAFLQSPDYNNATTADLDAWKAKRESLIFHNFKRALGAYPRLYAHMGAAHAKKKEGWVAYELETSADSPVKGAVVSTMPVYGPGSEVSYGGAKVPLHPYPPIVADALLPLPGTSYVVATAQPNQACVRNPLAHGHVAMVGGAGRLYDAFVFVDKLTPQEAPTSFPGLIDPPKTLGGPQRRAYSQVMLRRLQAMNAMKDAR